MLSPVQVVIERKETRGASRIRRKTRVQLQTPAFENAPRRKTKEEKEKGNKEEQEETKTTKPSHEGKEDEPIIINDEKDDETQEDEETQEEKEEKKEEESEMSRVIPNIQGEITRNKDEEEGMKKWIGEKISGMENVCRQIAETIKKSTHHKKEQYTNIKWH